MVHEGFMKDSRRIHERESMSDWNTRHHRGHRAQDTTVWMKRTRNAVANAPRLTHDRCHANQSMSTYATTLRRAMRENLLLGNTCVSREPASEPSVGLQQRLCLAFSFWVWCEKRNVLGKKDYSRNAKPRMGNAVCCAQLKQRIVSETLDHSWRQVAGARVFLSPPNLLITRRVVV